MSEQIVATSVLHPEHQSVLNIIETTPLTIGYGSEKQHILATIDGTDRTVSLIERNYDPKLVPGWLALRQAGIPVPPTLRYSSRNTLLLSDVKADGSEVYGRGLAVQDTLSCIDPTIERQRPRPDIDQIFIKMCGWYGMHKVRKAAFKYADSATENGISLPYDDPFELLVRPNGSWGFITLDVRETGKEVFEKDLRGFFNRDVTEKFLDSIQGLRKSLLRKAVVDPAA